MDFEWILDFESIINSHALGTAHRKLHWRLNTGKEKDNRKVISDRFMPNIYVRKFMNHFEELLELCVINKERLAKWNEVISLLIILMEFAKCSDFTEEDIVKF